MNTDDTRSVNALKPRPTTYKGVEMRSRLEATFAANLDSIGVAWAYEPECYATEVGQYLPDFLVETEGLPPIFYEVKPPNADMDQALLRMHIIRASIPDANLFVVTTSGKRWQSAALCLALDPCDQCA